MSNFTLENNINISLDAIASIVEKTIQDIEGVKCKGSIFTGNGSAIKISNEEVMVLDLRISVDYGVSIPGKCAELQQKITSEVQTMTNIKINKINIFVEDVNMK